jgi:hypothetical protein
MPVELPVITATFHRLIPISVVMRIYPHLYCNHPRQITVLNSLKVDGKLLSWRKALKQELSELLEEDAKELTFF